MRAARLAAIILPVAISNYAHAGIWFVNTQTGGIFGQQVALDRVGVERNGTDFSYFYSDLILPTITGIRQTDSPLVVTNGATHSDGNLFLRDQFLTTGNVDLPQGNGSLFDSTTQWLQLTFDSPVINAPGADLLLFRMDFPSILVNGPIPVRLSLDPAHTAQTSSVRDFTGSALGDIPDYLYPAGPYTSPAALNSSTVAAGAITGSSWSIQTFDLSSLGVPAGGSISSLYLQQTNNNGTYLTMVAGLPAPEPSALGLAAAGSWMLLWGRRRRKSRGGTLSG